MIQRLIELLGLRSPDAYRRQRPLILVNGLAEQGESWYRNRDVWQRNFDVHTPGVLVYDGPVLRERMSSDLPVTVGFLTDRLAEYLDRFVQSPPYHIVASSLGGQIAIEYAARNTEKVGKLVLLCPSGFGTEERLPIMDAARHKNFQGLVESTFHDRRAASPGLTEYYREKFASREWRRAMFETVRGTKNHSVRERLAEVRNPVLVVCGREDRIVDPYAVRESVAGISNYQFVMLPNCGHAPQLELPRQVNRLVTDFLGHDLPLATNSHRVPRIIDDMPLVVSAEAQPVSLVSKTS